MEISLKAAVFLFIPTQMYGLYVSKITFLEYSKNYTQNNFFKLNTRTKVQGIPVLGIFFDFGFF